MQTFELKIFNSDAELAETAANDWLGFLAKTPAKTLVALSGGRITKTFFFETARLAASSKVSWKNVHFFWADERCVPPDDPESNYRLALETLLGPLAIDPANIHRLRGELEPGDAVAYGNAEIRTLATVNAASTPILDLVFLGIGEDGHVASLFPNASLDVIECKEPFLHVGNSPKPPPRRLSMSFATLAAARNVWVMAAGAGKEQALRESVKPDATTPLGRLLQMRASTQIYTDIKISL